MAAVRRSAPDSGGYTDLDADRCSLEENRRF